MPGWIPLQPSLNNSDESVCDERQPWLLPHGDLQAVDASGQTISSPRAVRMSAQPKPPPG
jgi:hypothetical protein